MIVDLQLEDGTPVLANMEVPPPLAKVGATWHVEFPPPRGLERYTVLRWDTVIEGEHMRAIVRRQE